MASVDRPLRLAVVGLGFGRAVHLPIFCEIEGVEVVAVGASRRAKAEEAAAAFGIPQAFDDFPALLDQRLDAVSLALPPAVGAAMARQALARDLAVLTEKPLAGDATEARAVARLAAHNTTAVDFTFPELAAFKKLKALVEEQALGAVRSVNISWLTHSYAHRNGAWSWKVDAERHGGVMTAQGSHMLHLLDWLFGPPTLEYAGLDRRATLPLAPPGARPAEDGAVLALRLPNGARVAAILSNASPASGQHRWEVVCDRGMITVQNEGLGIMGGFSLVARDDGGQIVVSQPPEQPGAQDDRLAPFRSLALRFVAAVRNRSSFQPDFAAGARVQELIAQAFAMDAQRAPGESVISPRLDS